MPPPTIRPARTDEYAEIARVWMNSWVSTGLEQPSNFLLANLRARISIEMEKGWNLFVADDAGTIAAMLALHLAEHHLASYSLRRNIRAEVSGADCSRSLVSSCPTKSRCVACARMRRHGAGTSVKALRSKRKRSSR